jgi:triosephosphate isomerase
MRTPFIAGNWKMHKTRAEAQALAVELKESLGSVAPSTPCRSGVYRDRNGRLRS